MIKNLAQIVWAQKKPVLASFNGRITIGKKRPLQKLAL